MLSPGHARLRGFTLLEVIIAVMIISFMTITVYRFVQTDLTGIRASSVNSAERAANSGLIEFVRSQLEDLPVQGQGLLLGNPGTIRNLPSDELQWICRAGPGVLTTSGPDEYRVTLAIQPVSQRGSELEIGLRRQVTTQDEKSYNWLPLLRPASAMEVRYYDPRLNAWVERWSDVLQRPTMVRLRVWRTADEAPLEAILPVPSARSQGAMGMNPADVQNGIEVGGKTGTAAPGIGLPAAPSGSGVQRGIRR